MGDKTSHLNLGTVVSVRGSVVDIRFDDRTYATDSLGPPAPLTVRPCSALPYRERDLA